MALSVLTKVLDRRTSYSAGFFSNRFMLSTTARSFFSKKAENVERPGDAKVLDHLYDVDALEDQDILKTKTDSFQPWFDLYHPAIVRAFKEFENIPDSPILWDHRAKGNSVDALSESQRMIALHKLHDLARDLLQYMSTRIHKFSGKATTFLHLPMKYEHFRSNESVILGLQLARSIRLDKELDSLSASLAILQPQSQKLWSALDKAVASKEFGIKSTLIFHHVLLRAHRDPHDISSRLDFSTSLKLPSIVHLAQVELEKSVNATLENSAAIFAPIANSGIHKVMQSRAVELLGLYLESLVVVKKVTRKDKNTDINSSGANLLSKKSIAEIVATCQTVLASVLYPVSFMSLKLVWENIAKLELCGAYSAHKQLYEQVFVSVKADPLQIVNQEEAVTTLLESMVESKYKNSRLMQEICSILGQRGFNADRFGPRMFNALALLDEIPFSVKVLEKVMLKIDKNGTGMLNGINISLDTKTRIFNTLAYDGIAKPRTTRDLLLSLYTFGWVDRQSSGPHFYRLFESIEAEVLPAVIKQVTDTQQLGPGLGLHGEEAEEEKPVTGVSNGVARFWSILKGYGAVGRKHPDIIRAMDSVSLDTLCASHSQMADFLWVAARLNHRSERNFEVASRFFSHLRSISSLSTGGLHVMVKTLWSISILELIDLQLFVELQGKLLRKVKTPRQVQKELGLSSLPSEKISHFDIGHLGHCQLSQMQLILAELKTRKKTDISLSSVKNVDDGFNKQILSSWLSHVPNNDKRSFESSWNHKDVSIQLNNIGVQHDNEKCLEHGYVVDIFISPHKMVASVEGGGVISPSPLGCPRPHKGTVIEYDGPAHFESYLQQPLGPTVAKQRHLKALGYRVISVPYWEYNAEMDSESKKKYLLKKLSVDATDSYDTHR